MDYTGSKYMATRGPTINSLAHLNRKTTFTYFGSVRTGVTLVPLENQLYHLSFSILYSIQFRGETIHGGFSVRNLTPGGVGEWVKHNSQDIQHCKPHSKTCILYCSHIGTLAWISTEQKLTNINSPEGLAAHRSTRAHLVFQ
jgi:hypothetical protein